MKKSVPAATAGRSRRSRFVPALFVILAVALAVWTLRPLQGSAPGDVVFTLIDGRRVSLQSLRGRPVLVSFWATSCPVCLREIPHLKALYRDAAPMGLVMVAVAMPYDPPSEVLELAASQALPYDVALDVQGQTLRAFRRVPGTPTHFFIDGDGRIVFQRVGRLDTDDLMARLRRRADPP